MRHRKKKLKFARSLKQAKRLWRNLLANLILYERIKTTKAKAKKLKGLLDQLINIGKKQNLASQQQLFKFFYIKEPVKKINEDLIKRYKNKKSGYSRIIPIGIRKGDGAEMVIWELIEEEKPKTQKQNKTKKPKHSFKTKIKN